MGGARGFAWGFVAQGFASATNFGLSVLAGRLLGPGGLGVVFIGFSAYQLVLGLQRATVTQPLVAHAAPLTAPKRLQLIHSGLAIVVSSGLVASVALATAGLIVGGDIGRGFVVFAPWVVPGVLQEFWKAVLFQEGKASAGALSDAIRLGIMGLSLPLALEYRSDFLIVSAWGVGAAAGFGIGIVNLAAGLSGPRDALKWLRGEAGILGRWLGAREVVYQIGTYSTVLVLAFVIGSENLGGLRSAEALFSPFSLIAAAFVLPALPALARALTRSRDAAQRLALLISGVAIVLGLGYFGVMIVIGGWLLTHLFGSSFSEFKTLIWPMAVAQLFYAGSFAFTVLLIAEKRGAKLFIVGIVGSAATVGFATALGSLHGVIGAAWGLTTAAAIASVLVVLLGLRLKRRVQNASST